MEVADKAKYVRKMFDRISGRYDLANDILSLGMHRIWEAKAVKLLSDNSAGQVLDLCSGTGALLQELSAKFVKVTAADFSEGMLAHSKQRNKKLANVEYVLADALQMPFPDNFFEAAIVSYGVRNFADLSKGLTEILRVLKPGGEIVILEFGQPVGFFGRTFRFYSHYILPILGQLITGDREAYLYLDKTAATFPCGSKFTKELESHGFANILEQRLLFGLCFLYRAIKPK